MRFFGNFLHQHPHFTIPPPRYKSTPWGCFDKKQNSTPVGGVVLFFIIIQDVQILGVLYVNKVTFPFHFLRKPPPHFLQYERSSYCKKCVYFDRRSKYTQLSLNYYVYLDLRSKYTWFFLNFSVFVLYGIEVRAINTTPTKIYVYYTHFEVNSTS